MNIFILCLFLLFGGHPGHAQSFKLDSGAVLDDTCIRMAKKFNRTPEEIKKKFEDLIARSQEKMDLNCSQKYPELKLYLDQWRKRISNLTVACGGKGMATTEIVKAYFSCIKDKSKNECKSSLGLNVGQALRFKEQVYATFDKNDADRMTTTTLQKNNPVISMSETEMIKLMSETNNDSVLNTFFHEVLHLTEANNHKSHNEIEAVTFEKEEMKDPETASKSGKPLCGNNITKDRINLISSLCTDTYIEGSVTMKAPEAMAIVNSQCGGKRSCVDIFQSDEEQEDGYNRPLPKKDAKSFCSKILFEGTCQRYFSSPEYHSVFAKIEPLKTRAEKVVDRLRTFLPLNSAQIPGPLMNHMLSAFENPDGVVKEMREDDCLKNILTISSDQKSWNLTPYYKNKFGVGKNGFENDKERWKSAVKDQNFNNVLDYALVGMTDHPHCNKEKIKKWSAVFDKMKPKGPEVFQAPLVQDLLNRTVATILEKNPEVDMKDQNNLKFSKIIGTKMVDDYIQSRKKYHPKSELFDCEKSSVANHLSFFSYEEFMGHFLKINQSMSCPQ